MADSSINEYEARGTNIVHCPRVLHVADATNNCTIIASKTLQVQHPGSNLYMYKTINSIHNAINIKETHKWYQ